MFFESIKKTLEFPKLSKVARQNYINFLAETYSLSHNGHHGLEHWLRVLINGRLLAEATGADLEVVEHFALIHDVMRENENMDIHHGPRSAEFVKSLAGTWIKLEEQQLQLLVEACMYHSVGRLDQNVTIQTCWDADRLDLGRVGIDPKPAYLGSDLSRDPNFIEMANLRSKKRFVREDFSDG